MVCGQEEGGSDHAVWQAVVSERKNGGKESQWINDFGSQTVLKEWFELEP